MTATQNQMLNSLERRANKIIGGNKMVPSTANCMKKAACRTVKKIIENKIENKAFDNYFEVLNHEHSTRNNKSLIRLPKIRTEFG